MFGKAGDVWSMLEHRLRRCPNIDPASNLLQGTTIEFDTTIPQENNMLSTDHICILYIL